MRINIFKAIKQSAQSKNISSLHVYPNYYKKKIHLSNLKKKNCPVNIKMINLSFGELRLIAQARNVSGYENKSQEDLIKTLS